MEEDDDNLKGKQNVDLMNPKRNMTISSGTETTASSHYVSLCLKSSNPCVSQRLLIYGARAEPFSFESRANWKPINGIKSCHDFHMDLKDYDSCHKLWQLAGIWGSWSWIPYVTITSLGWIWDLPSYLVREADFTNRNFNTQASAFMRIFSNTHF